MILNSNKTFFLSTIKEKIINFICDKFNIADYPNLHDFIDVKQLDIVNVYDKDILYKIKIRLKRHGEVTINNLEEHREVIETVVERPIKFEIVDYKNVYVNVLYLDKEKEGNIETNNIVRYEYFPAESFDKDTADKTIRYEFVEGEKEGLSFYIGKDLEGTDFKLNILDGSLLIGGMTGTGKGNIINVLVTSLMLTYTENELVFLGCDVTKSDVYYFGRYKHFRGMASTWNEFLEQAEWLENKLYKERAEILNKANCRNVISYNNKHDKKMSYYVFVIDEVVLLTRNAKCRDKLHDIMCVGRKYGCYFVLCLQDATKDTIGKCKMNCPQVIGLGTNDETDSNTIIGKNQNLQDIKEPGRCKIKTKKGITEVQSMFIDEDRIEELLKPYLKE